VIASWFWAARDGILLGILSDIWKFLLCLGPSSWNRLPIVPVKVLSPSCAALRTLLRLNRFSQPRLSLTVRSARLFPLSPNHHPPFRCLYPLRRNEGAKLYGKRKRQNYLGLVRRFWYASKVIFFVPVGTAK
jgi:hypothetical protein